MFLLTNLSVFTDLVVHKDIVLNFWPIVKKFDEDFINTEVIFFLWFDEPNESIEVGLKSTLNSIFILKQHARLFIFLFLKAIIRENTI